MQDLVNNHLSVRDIVLIENVEMPVEDIICLVVLDQF